jgi:hypothetical protein
MLYITTFFLKYKWLFYCNALKQPISEKLDAIQKWRKGKKEKEEGRRKTFLQEKNPLSLREVYSAL